MATTAVDIKKIQDSSTSGEPGQSMTRLEAFLLSQESKTYAAYYNGKMSIQLAGKEWKKHVQEQFPDVEGMQTSENIFKDVIDLYVSNLMPTPHDLKGFGDTLVPLLCRGEAPVLVMADGTVSFPERYEMLSDGDYVAAVIYTRSLQRMEDYATFAYSDGTTRLFSKPVPDDFAPADKIGYKFVEEKHGATLFRFALDDKGMGGALAALQDRTNHSVLDQTAVAEMYARPFWYLLNTELPVKNPYLPAGSQPQEEALKEKDVKGSGARVFVTSSEGPFGQLTPPTLGDMVDYHDSIIGKVSQSTGIPEFYFKPGGGQAPSGVSLKVLSRRYNNKVSRIRTSIEDQLMELAQLMGIKPAEGDKELVLWDTTDDLLQEALDQHGESLFRMGYPLEYIAEVVTPGVNLEDYLDDGFKEEDSAAVMAQKLYLGVEGGKLLKVHEARQMLRNAGAPLDADDDLATLDAAVNGGPTPDQVAAYAANPGQQAGEPAMNPVPSNVNPLHPSTGSNGRPVNPVE